MCQPQIRMNFIKSLLSPRSRQKQELLVSQLVARTGLRGAKELKDNSQKQLMECLAKSEAPHKFIKTLLGQVQKMEKIEELAKLFTLIHGTACLTEYAGLVMEALEHLDLVIGHSSSKQQASWFCKLYAAYISYLAKLPSVSEVYLRAKNNASGKAIGKETQLIDLFRIVNQLCLLLDALISTFNTIGRYYKNSKNVYLKLYKIISGEFRLLYEYMRNIVNRLFTEFRDVEPKQLRVFLEAIPEIELMTDKLEQFLNCKYFDGAKLESQVYFKADEIQKVSYYLQVQLVPTH